MEARGVRESKGPSQAQEPVPLANVILAFFSTQMEYRDQGRLKLAPRHELLFRRAIEEAMKGSVAAAEFILTLRMNAQRFGTARRRSFGRRRLATRLSGSNDTGENRELCERRRCRADQVVGSGTGPKK